MNEAGGAATHDATNPVAGFPNAQAPRHVGSLQVDAEGQVEKPKRPARKRAPAKKATAPAKKATAKKAAAKRA